MLAASDQELRTEIPTTDCRSRLRNPPAWHRGLPGPSGPESEKSPKGCPRASNPGEPQSPQRVRPGVRKESTKSPKLRFWTLFGLRGALFGDSGAPRGRRPRHTLSDSFRTFLGFWARGAREPSVPGRGVPKSRPDKLMIVSVLAHGQWRFIRVSCGRGLNPLNRTCSFQVISARRANTDKPKHVAFWGGLFRLFFLDFSRGRVKKHRKEVKIYRRGRCGAHFLHSTNSKAHQT